MKHYVLFLFLWSFGIFAQTDELPNGFAYSLRVKNVKGAPDPNRKIVFIEANTYERQVFSTNASGSFSHVFEGGNWLGSVDEMKNCIEIDASRPGKSKETITYDPIGYKLQNKSVPDRRSIDFKTVSQARLSPSVKPTAKETILTVVLADRSRKVYPGIEVQACNYATQTIYKGRTNGNGAVTFKLPIGLEYEIDVDGVESIRRIQLPQRPKMARLQVLFQPKEFGENQKNDLIVQKLKPDVRPSTSHAKIKLSVSGGSKDGIKEDVYVRMLKSNKVYSAKTNDKGEAIFMLPIRQKYFIDFNYQRDAKQIDLSKVKGIAEQSMHVHYTPDPRMENIEDFIPSIEELIEYDVQNFIDKQYPEPEMGDIDFQLSWGNKFNKNSKEALLEVGMKVKSKMNRKAAPLNLCFVIDKSGSMMGDDRIEQLKKSLIDFINRLDSTDIISVVVFDDQPRVAVPAEQLGDKQKAIDIIHAIRAGGGTVIYSGLEKGFDEVRKHHSSGFVNRVMLLSDGYGSRPPREVAAMAKRNIKLGIELSAVGVGTNYNQALLSKLASAGGGLMHLAGNAKNIQDAFRHELESVLYAVASKAKLEVLYNDEIVYRQLYGYLNEKVTSGKMSVDIPHLFPGLNQMALIKFDLINPTRKIEREKVVVRLSYVEPESGETIKLEKNISPEWSEATGELDMTIDKEHKKVLAVAIANQSLKVMANSFEAGDRIAAQQSVQSAIDQIKELFPKAKPEELLSLVQRLTEYVNAFEQLKSMRTHQ